MSLWSKDFFRNSFSLVTLLMVPVVIALNVVGSYLNRILGLPLYLDSIGTIFLGIIAGPWVAGLGGLLTNVFIAISRGAVNTLPFGLVSLLIGVAAGILSYYGFFTTVFKTVIAAIVITLVTIISAAPLVLLVYGGATGSNADSLTAILLGSGLKVLQAVFSMQIITNGSDKFLSVIICLLLLKSMPRHFMARQPLGYVYQKKKQKPAEKVG